jgi:hypothetical protein
MQQPVINFFKEPFPTGKIFGQTSNVGAEVESGGRVLVI